MQQPNLDTIIQERRELLRLRHSKHFRSLHPLERLEVKDRIVTLFHKIREEN